MKGLDYHKGIAVDVTAQEAFNCINNVTKWWTENFEGSSQEPGDDFTVRFGETFITAKVVEFIPAGKIVWQVTDCNKPWLKDKKEWIGTKMSWEISEKGNKTQISFTHLGLVPDIECFEVCSNAWNEYIQQSLLSLINTGKGRPNKKENKTKDKSKSVKG